MYFKGLDEVTKYYIHDLLEVDPEKRPSARSLFKQKFLTDTASADSPESVRAQKRRRTSLETATQMSPLLNKSWNWALSKREPDLAMALMELGIKPIDSSEVYDILDLFRADRGSLSAIRFRKLVAMYEPSFWRTHVPGFLWKSVERTTLWIGPDDVQEAVTSDSASDTLSAIPSNSRQSGDGWYAVYSNCITNLSHVQTFTTETSSWSGSRFSTNGRYLAIFSRLFAIKLYELRNDHESTYFTSGVVLFQGKGDNTSLCFTQDGSQLAVATFGGVNVWDIAKKTSESLTLTNAGYFSIDISRDDSRLVGVGAGGLTVWNLETKDVIAKYRPTDGNLLMARDGEFIVAGIYCRKSGAAGTSFLINDVPGTPLVLVQGRAPEVACSNTKPGEFVSAGSEDHTVEFWTSEERLATISAFEEGEFTYFRTSKTFTGHQHEVSALAFSQDDKWIAAGSYQGSVRVWNVNDGTLVVLLNCSDFRSVASIVFPKCEDGTLIAVLYNDGLVRLWRFDSSEGESQAAILKQGTVGANQN